MVKNIGRRFLSFFMVAVMVLVLLPEMTLPTFAATSGAVSGLTDANIDLSFFGTGDDAWTATGIMITGSVTSTDGCSAESYKSTLTIKNNSGSEAMLSFDYTTNLNGGTITVAGSSVTADVANVNFSKELAANETVTVYIESKDNSKNTTSITLANVKLVEVKDVTTTFVSPNGGSYTVDSMEVTGDWTNTQSSTVAYSVAATAASNYIFVDWYWTDSNGGNGKEISTKQTDTALYVNESGRVCPRFVPMGTPIFDVGGQRFTDLTAADACAANGANGNTIVLLNDATLPAGSYTISSGVTLLIPGDSNNTLYTTAPAIGGFPSSNYSRTLTMAEGATITVNGAISLAGSCGVAYPDSTAEQNVVSSVCGCVKMSASSEIIINSGANLYAWGFAIGDGLITVKNGGTVWEVFQIRDYVNPYAVISSKYRANGHFPITQYYVQNVEAALKLEAGATEKAWTVIYASGEQTMSFDFIGDSGLFNVVSGSLTKKYDGTKDRIEYTIDGEAELNSISLTIKGQSIDSSEYNLPMTSNMTINVVANESDASLMTVKNDVAMFAGVELNIARNAEVKLISGKTLYVYDTEQWGNYVHLGGVSSKFLPCAYAPSRTYNRTEADLVSAKIDVNGTLTVAGKLYTTESGANITSSEGTGRVVWETAAPSAATTKQPTSVSVGGFNSVTVTWDTINVNPAWLKNADGSYFETKSASAGDVFYYCKTKCGGVWHKVGTVNVAEVGGTQYTTLTEAVGKANGATVTMLHDTTEDAISAGGFVLDLAGCAVNADLTGAFSGLDTSGGYGEVDGKMVYTTPTGKITGKADSVNKTYQTATSGAFQRYVAITNADGETSFHRFNISVTSFRTLFNPSDGGRGALHFEALFRGDGAVMGEVKEIGFTLTCAGSKATDTPTTTKPIQNSELFISDAVWDKPLTATSVAEDCTATAYIKFDDSAKGTVTSLPQSIDYITALKTAYYGGMLRLTTDAANEDDAKAIVDKYLSEHETIKTAWDSAKALTTNGYVA